MYYYIITVKAKRRNKDIFKEYEVIIMRKMISCLAILTMLASMVSCRSTESGGTSDNTVPTKAAVTTTVAETSKDEKTTTASNGAEKSKDTTKNDTSANDETNSTLVLKEEDRLFGAYVDTQGTFSTSETSLPPQQI